MTPCGSPPATAKQASRGGRPSSHVDSSKDGQAQLTLTWQSPNKSWANLILQMREPRWFDPGHLSCRGWYQRRPITPATSSAASDERNAPALKTFFVAKTEEVSDLDSGEVYSAGTIHGNFENFWAHNFWIIWKVRREDLQNLKTLTSN